jgi:hypothetical protein
MKRGSLVLAALLTVGCPAKFTAEQSPDNDAGPDAGDDQAQDAAIPDTGPEDTGVDAGPTPAATNPHGVPYPTTHIGTKPRDGLTPGDIANLACTGYHSSASALGTVSMIDVYDPAGRTFDVVMIVLGGGWDPHSDATMNAALASTKRIAVLFDVGEGTDVAKAPTLTEIQGMRIKYPAAALLLDPFFAEFKAFDAPDGSVPTVIFLDARTMEIDYAAVGGIETPQAIDAHITSITSRAPAY